MDLPNALLPLTESPSTTALLFDFDGTLAPIVDDPAAARPAPGAIAVLRRLDERFKTVAVISGRPVAFLDAQVPEPITLSGLYGLQERAGGIRSEADGMADWRRIIGSIAVEARAVFPVDVVEDKGLSLTLHHRRHAALADEIEMWTSEVAAARGVHRRSAKASVELHPAVELDKGTVVDALRKGCARVAYVGDDVGDLPAFAAVERAGGVRIVVSSAETPPEVLAAGDVVVDGPAELVALLEALADATDG